ncbi:MAG TPA: response regulator [Gammaproteobacteria bacterium]|jgi:DNA-binding response OmpR family regulator|nr:response regulator [Gammaproteobacteria bacterium]
MKTLTKQILLVEDDRFLRRACAAGLRQRGWTVLTAVDGEEALRMVQSERIDLVLLDMLMPKLHGLDVMRALKAEERTQSIPVLVLSNSSRERDVQEIMKLGAVGYLVKANLSLQELGNRVAELLGG